MPLVDGGDVTNLITSFLEEPNHSYSSGGQILLAQTFPLWEPTYLYLAVIRTYAPIPGYEQFLDIRAIDWQGRPTGANLASKMYQNSKEAYIVPGTWKLFKFSPVPYLDPGGYCLVFSTPGTPDYTGAAWAAQQSEDPYPLGKAWLSVNNGLTWERLNYEAFLFQVWGWSPPPVPPVAPTVGNWAVLSMMFNELADGYEIIVTTDIPCHLFMRWSTSIPLKHGKAKVVRGLSVMSGTRFCFVAWTENEQEEAGDTYIHTFIKLGWAVCVTRWFYFTGTKQVEEMPSSTAVFWRHRTQTAFVQYFKEPWTAEIAPPPTFASKYLEPWTYLAPPPPTFVLKFIEPWSEWPYIPGLYFLEPWSYLAPPPPTMVQKYYEPWSS